MRFTEPRKNIQTKILHNPMLKQALFYESPCRFKLFAGGMGSGKTIAGAAHALQLSLQYPRNVGLVGRATYPELRDSTRKEFLAFPVQCDGVDYELVNSPLIKSFNKAENILEFNNGSIVVFRALEDGFQKIKSLNLGWFWVDELTENSEEIWLGLVGRLRLKGVPHKGFGTSNPEGRDWVWKRFIANPDSQHFAITADSRENEYLPEGYIDSLEKQFPEEWVKRYIHGSFDTFEGLIYKDFIDRPPYVIPNFDIPDSWYRFVSVDHGFRNPTAVLWGAVSPVGRLVIYDEFYSSGKLVSEISEIIKTKNRKDKIRLYLIDPSTRAHKGNASGLSITEEFEENELYFYPANNDVRAGINHVQEYLKLDEKGIPKVQIFSSCVNLRTELQTYRWKDLKPGAIQDAPEKPVKKLDHCVDAFRYLVCYIYDMPKPTHKETGWKVWIKKFHNEPENHWMAA